MERRNLINMVLISLATFLAGLSLTILAPFYPTEALTKEVTVSQTGMVIGSVFITTILVTPVCGQHIQSLGARRFLILGALTVGLGNAGFGSLQAVSDHIPFLSLSVVIRVLTAVGESCVATASITLAGQQTLEEHRGKAISVVETGFGVGTMLGPTVGGVLYDYGGFFLPFTVTGVLSVLVSLASYCFLLGDPDRGGGGGGQERHLVEDYHRPWAPGQRGRAPGGGDGLVLVLCLPCALPQEAVRDLRLTDRARVHDVRRLLHLVFPRGRIPH